MAYDFPMWQLIISAIAAMLWLLASVVVCIVMAVEKKRLVKYEKRAAQKRMRIESTHPFRPASYAASGYPPQFISLEPVTPNIRDTPKIIPLDSSTDDVRDSVRRKETNWQLKPERPASKRDSTTQNHARASKRDSTQEN